MCPTSPAEPSAPRWSLPAEINPAPMPLPILKDHVLMTAGHAFMPLAQGHHVDIVVNPDRHAVTTGEPILDGIPIPPGHDWRGRWAPTAKLDRTGNPNRDPTELTRKRKGLATQFAKRASTRPRMTSGPVAMSASSARCATILPPRSLRATSMLVAPRSATRTCPASAQNRIWREGRPPVLGAVSDSVTRPRATSSSTRWATTARPYPVSRAITARVPTPWRRMILRTAASSRVRPSTAPPVLADAVGVITQSGQLLLDSTITISFWTKIMIVKTGLLCIKCRTFAHFGGNSRGLKVRLHLGRECLIPIDHLHSECGRVRMSWLDVLIRCKKTQRGRFPGGQGPSYSAFSSSRLSICSRTSPT